MTGTTITSSRGNPSARHRMTIGDFVRVSSVDFGIGKILDLSGGVALVSWFHSPTRPVAHEASFSESDLEFIDLTTHRRVYHYDPLHERWRVGRVEDSGRVAGHHFGGDADLYYIAFPNHDTCRVPIPKLFVRWNRPLDDPAAILAARATVTPFWHSARTGLLRSAMTQRAACGGLTGLFSASIDLQPHQVRVVRTVLNDPTQRYLLADEVGLGKTIEALAILRQLVLEHPTRHDTLIVVPQHLRAQWQAELRLRFGLGSLLGHSIRILGLKDLEGEAAPQLLIVDEAHHPAAHAHSPRAEERRCYEVMARLAHSTPRLLLLSATPVLRNESGFLAMLHLLDPTSYPLQEREAFRERVSQRQQIANWLGDLQDDASPLFMEDALNGLTTLLNKDQQLIRLVEAAGPLVDEDEENLPRQHALAALRAHIGEVYRLHRRLLRTRRSSLADPLRGRAGAQIFICEDPVRIQAEQLLDEWRGELTVAVHQEKANRAMACALWRVLFEASVSHPLALRELVEARLASRPTLDDLAPCPKSILHQPPLFDSEEHLLLQLADLLEDYVSPRGPLLLEHFRQNPQDRFVVFVDRPAIAQALSQTLQLALGDVVRMQQNHDDVAAFTDRSVRILVCDAAAEEGLNLQQSSATLVHYDLPLAPNRIEQRLGRLDRFGAKRSVRSVVFDDGAPMCRRWARLLAEPIRVFNESIASLQYVLNAHLQNFIDRSFDEGPEAWDILEQALRNGEQSLNEELKRIRRQEGLDALEVDQREAKRFEAMEDFDLDHDRLQKDLEDWLVSRLQFGVASEDKQEWFRRYAFRKDGKRRTLIPIEHWNRWFHGMARSTSDASNLFAVTPTLTYRRRQAHLKLLPLARLGHPLFDGAVDHARHDDRGVAFVMWRWRPEFPQQTPLLAFRFDFSIQADLRHIQGQMQADSELSGQAIRRRLDGLLAPRFLTVWLSADLESIDDPRMLQMLVAEYNDRLSGDGQDFNVVGDRWSVVEEHYPVANWARLVDKTEAEAQRQAREAPNLLADCQRARRDLDVWHTRVVAQLQARIERLDGAARASEQAHLDREQSLFSYMNTALRNPSVTLDSAAAIFLAADSPFAEGDR